MTICPLLSIGKEQLQPFIEDKCAMFYSIGQITTKGYYSIVLLTQSCREHFGLI